MHLPARHPDIWGIVQHGVVYTGKTKKIAEHGGADPQDRHVPLLVYAPSATHHGGRIASDPVQTIQIAPTILPRARPGSQRPAGRADRAHAGAPRSALRVRPPTPGGRAARPDPPAVGF